MRARRAVWRVVLCRGQEKLTRNRLEFTEESERAEPSGETGTDN
jgi:hypothetical protein